MIKRELAKQLKRRERQESQILRAKQRQKSEIKQMECGLKSLYESVYSEKMNEVRLQKASLIKDEI